ncbi:MAG: ATP-binding protein [Acidobacteria bacterium]|nr:ATP-binding protein [Acidobacteriota bacterium]
MITRRYAETLHGLLRRWPAVTMLGPRQCGKTTFSRHALPDWTYVDLERPSDAAPLLADPEARLDQLGDHVIFDEAQRVPELFAVLRSAIDQRRSRHGRFLLLGSSSPRLVTGVAESLAGRTAFLDLPAFRWDEVQRAGRQETLSDLWLRGGFPAAFLARGDRARAEWLDAYTRAFIERDLPALGVEVSAARMRQLWTMLAHSNGGLWNASQLAASLGVSYHTVNRYVDVLEQTFLIRRLPPFFANIRKRLVKSPKVYFRDSGLLHAFLGIDTATALHGHPARGLSWEAFVIDQLIAAFQRVRPGYRPNFWRTALGQEVDLLMDDGRRQVPFEIKLRSTPTIDDARGVLTCMKDLGLRRGYVIYPGREAYSLGHQVTALPADQLLNRPQDVAKL